MNNQDLLTLADRVEALIDFETPDAVALNNALHDLVSEPKCVQPPNFCGRWMQP